MKNFILLSMFAFFASAAHAQSSYLIVDDAIEGTLARIDTTQRASTAAVVQSSILWNYDVAEASEEGNSFPGRREQSAKSDYLVHCASNSVALSSWSMFGEANASGEMLWSDAIDGQLEFRQPVRSAEHALIKLACETTVAQR